MANPFGGSDQALSKNTGHTNQANLIYAIVPRTTTKWREVVVGTDINVSAATGASYDADGYWIPGSTTVYRPTALSMTSRLVANDITVIVGVKRNAGAGAGSNNSWIGPVIANAQDFSSVRAAARLNYTTAAIWGSISDYNNNGVSAAEANVTSTSGPYGIAVAHGVSNTTQKGFVRVGGATDTAFAGSSYTFTTNGAYVLEKLVVDTQDRWPFQYVFVYDAYLSDANINAIIDSPGDVLSQASSFNSAWARGANQIIS